jgi:hypothetical protein
MASDLVISVKVDARSTIRFLDDMRRKHVPFATALALTRTAKQVEKALASQLASGLESPSPYTKRATFSTSATKATLQAKVGIKDKKPAGGTAPAVLLKEHFGGGARGNKPMEKAVASMGLLPSGWRMVVGAGMPVDAYGNPRRNVVRELIGALRSRTQIYKGKGKRMALVGYFAVPVGASSHLEPGIYWRKGRALRPMFLFVKQATYRKRFDLPKIGREVVDREFDQHFSAALTQATATAR